MTVQDLIDKLLEEDPTAEVWLSHPGRTNTFATKVYRDRYVVTADFVTETVVIT